MTLRSASNYPYFQQAIIIYTVVFFVWGVYRLLFSLNPWFEETILKFLVFGLPPIWFSVFRDKNGLKSLGMRTENLFKSLIFGLLFGVWLGVILSSIQFVTKGIWGITYYPQPEELKELMILGLFTAFWQQLFFSGFILDRIHKDFQSEATSAMITGLLFSGLHIPIQLIRGIGLSDLIIQGTILFTLGYGCSILMFRYKNLLAPIFAHFSWGILIFLFSSQ